MLYDPAVCQPNTNVSPFMVAQEERSLPLNRLVRQKVVDGANQSGTSGNTKDTRVVDSELPAAKPAQLLRWRMGLGGMVQWARDMRRSVVQSQLLSQASGSGGWEGCSGGWGIVQVVWGDRSWGGWGSGGRRFWGRGGSVDSYRPSCFANLVI